MFKKLRNRLLFLNMTMISVVIITAFIVIYSVIHANIQKENQSKLDSIPLVSRMASADTDSPQSNQDDMKMAIVRIPVDYSLSFAVVVDKNGDVRDILSYIEMPDEVYRSIASSIWSTGKTDGAIFLEDREWQYRIAPYRMYLYKEGKQQAITEDELYKIAFLDITDSSRTLTQLLITFILVGVGMLIVLFGVSIYFANRSIRPIEESWSKQKQFVADASHELKTPLAIISANTEALLANGGETVSSQKKWIGYIRSETGRMAKMIGDMLYLAKVEGAHEEQAPFDLSHTVLDIIASMEAAIFEKGIKMTHMIEPGMIVKGDGERMGRVVLILLDNAVKYTNENGTIDVALKRHKHHAVFSVQNSGEEIPADKLPRIFDRFYRSDPSRSKETGGYGLGLSIAKTIIERSGGRIYARSAFGKTTFTFELRL